MQEIVFEINSDEEIWSLIDKDFDHLYIHKFTPNQAIEWWKTDIRMKNADLYKDLQVRNMEFDVSTNLVGLKKLMELNTYNLTVYQFDRPIPHTLSIEFLPEEQRDKILQQNGLKHFYFLNYEFITIGSYSEKFIDAINANEVFRDRIR
ncbi:hypothetical protein [Sphingobacterium hungaricum]